MKEKTHIQRSTRSKKRRSPYGQETMEDSGITPVQTAPPEIVQMQRTVGNRAIQRIMDIPTASQRIPTMSVNKLGRLVRTKKSKGGDYFNMNREAMLNMLENVHTQLNSRLAMRPEGLMSQLQDVSNAYDGLVSSVSGLLEKLQDSPEDPRYAGALELRVQATNEKTQIIQIFLDKMKNPTRTRVMPTIKSLMGPSQPIYMDNNLITGQVGGGMNTLTKYAKQDGGTDYFKPNVDTIDHYQSLQESDNMEQNVLGPITNTLMEKSNQLMDTPDKIRNLGEGVDDDVNYGQFGGREGFAQAFETHQKKGVNTEFSEHAGIDLDNLRSSNREVAMSRLDTLLDAELISKAQLAIKKTGISSIPKLGSVAPEAKGKDISKYNLVDDQNAHPGTNDTIRRDDPALMSKLNSLQMIDFIAGQVDRHQGNYMIQVDGGGNVIGLTGIDNDMSFGTKDTDTLTQQGARQLPPLGMYFDKNMANKIIALEPALVRIALSDLLTPAEVNATLERLQVLKQKLQEDVNKLLDPGQWAQLIDQDYGSFNPKFKRGEYNTVVKYGQ